MRRKLKFGLAIVISVLWLIISIFLSIPWIHDLNDLVGYPLAIFIISGIAYIPGFISMNFIVSLLLLKGQDRFNAYTPRYTITILIPAFNEEQTIYQTIKSINHQVYSEKVIVIVINNNSTDHTVQEINKAIQDFNIPIQLIHEVKKGKHHALNTGISHVTTKYFITVDADTILHPLSISYLVNRMMTDHFYEPVAAIAGSVLVNNEQVNFITKLQKYDYFLSITGIKRMQSLYGSTLVAQGAFSIYETKIIKEIGGWYDCIGEDIVLTWKLLQMKYIIGFEPKAISYTNVPTTLKSFIKQRSRWARGMIEAFKHVFPFNQGTIYSKYLTFIDLLIPFVDVSYIFFFVPGIIFALMGHFILVGFLTLFVLPLMLMSYYLIYREQYNQVIRPFNLDIQISFIEFIFFMICFQALSSTASIIGYLQELFHLKRIWK